MILQALLVVASLQQAPTLGFQRYEIDPSRSEIGFDGESTVHDFTGRTRKVEGELRIRFDDLSECAGGRISIVAKSIDTDSDGRDEEMREVLETGRFPTISFNFSRASGHLEKGESSLKIKGFFAVHGQRRAKDVSVSITPLNSGALRARGHLNLKMSEFGLEPPSFLFISTDDQVKVWWDVVFVPVRSAKVSAREFPLSISKFSVQGATESKTAQYDDQLWLSEEAALWERKSSWSLSRHGNLQSVDFANGTIRPTPASSEESFQGTRERLDQLRAKLNRPGVSSEAVLKSSVKRTERILALAPPSSGASIVDQDGRYVLKLGDSSWLELSGNRGPGRVMPFLASFSGVPAEVIKTIQNIDYVPEFIRFRTATPGGVQRIDIKIGEPTHAELPAWAMNPESWVESRTGSGSR